MQSAVEQLIEMIEATDTTRADRPVQWGDPVHAEFRRVQREFGGVWPVVGVQAAWRRWREYPAGADFRDHLIGLLLDVFTKVGGGSPESPTEDQDQDQEQVRHGTGGLGFGSIGADRPAAVETVQADQASDSSDPE